jgi:hypothetical protein
MKLIILFLLSSCASINHSVNNDAVTLKAARNMALQSYLRGCQDANRKYEDCLSRAKKFINSNFDEIVK